MNSQEYWQRREEEALKHYIKDEAEYRKEINRIYSNMLDSCNEQINAFYGRYAGKEGITLAEAKKRVSELDIKAYERKAKRYVKDKDFSPKANEEMLLYNATMKINRFEMLKANIGLEMIAGHDELEKFMGGILKGRTEEELARQAGILGKTVRNNAQLAHAIPNASFHNANFSDRIWLYQDLMKADLDKLLQNGLIQGKNPRQLARELEKYVMEDATGGAKYRAETLMITELARVQTEAQKQSFERNSFEEYTFHANSGCCGDCQALDGKHFKVKDMMPGKNAAPMHPRCRCSSSAYSDRAEYEEWLDFLANGGTTEEYNKLKAQKINNVLTNKGAKGGIIQTGAYNNKNDPEGIKREAHAKKYYKSLRNSNKNDIVSAISKNVNIDADKVSKMYDHLIINRYDLDNGYSRFAPDYDISESIRRLREGKNIEKHDKILVYHEALEYDLMNKQGLDYETAHEIANKSYNYEEALDKWFEENEG